MTSSEVSRATMRIVSNLTQADVPASLIIGDPATTGAVLDDLARNLPTFLERTSLEGTVTFQPGKVNWETPDGLERAIAKFMGDARRAHQLPVIDTNHIAEFSRAANPLRAATASEIGALLTQDVVAGRPLLVVADAGNGAALLDDRAFSSRLTVQRI